MNPSANAFFAGVDNPSPARNTYPTAGGATLGTASGGGTVATMYSADGIMDEVTTAAPAASDSAAPAASGGLIGQPLTWWATLVALFFVLGFVAKRAGQESDFSNIRLSAYNILMIAIAAAIGIGAMKVLFTRFQVPGLSTFIQAL